MNLQEALQSAVYNEVIEKIRDRSAKIGIIGVGYVGQALVKGILEADFQVFGFDLDPKKLTEISHPNFFPTHEIGGLQECEIVCICVPTPLDESRKPDLKYLLRATADLNNLEKRNQLVIIESTVAPGTLRRAVLPEFLAAERKIGEDLLLAISPERIDPGNKNYDVRNTPKVVGGIDEISTGASVEFYSTFVEKVVPVSSPEAAELTKMLENTFRLVNISLINQIKDYADLAGIDIWEVIEAASTKPYAFMPHYPGPGVGGHCIPVDPAYLLEEAKLVGIDLSLIEQALKVNQEQGKKIVTAANKKLNGRSEDPDKKMFLVGVAYKPNTADTRESPALKIWEEAKLAGYEVSFYDPFVSEFAGQTSRLLTKELLEQQDVVVIVTDHDNLPIELLTGSGKPILDTRNALRKIRKVQTEKIDREYV